MAKETKKIKDITLGEVKTTVVALTEKHETSTHWILTWADGTVQELDKSADPSIEVGT